MPYTGGTHSAQNCIKQLTELSALVDVYSKQWLDAHPNFPYCNATDLDEYLSYLEDKCENDSWWPENDFFDPPKDWVGFE